MTRFCCCLFDVGLLLLLLVFSNSTCAAQPIVQIRSPRDGSYISHEQDHVLVGGKVFAETASSEHLDIFLVLDVSGSTAHYAGVDLADWVLSPFAEMVPT